MAKNKSDDVVVDTPSVLVPAAPLPLPVLVVTFMEDDDALRFHSQHAEKHLQQLGVKTELTPTSLSVWA